MWQRHIGILSKIQGSIYACILLSQESILLLRHRGRLGYRANSSGLHNGILDLRSVRTKCHEIWLHSILHAFLFYLVFLIQFVKRCIIILSLTLWRNCQLWPLYPLSHSIFDFFLYYLLQGQDLAPHCKTPYNYCYYDKKLPLLLCIKEIVSENIRKI